METEVLTWVPMGKGRPSSRSWAPCSIQTWPCVLHLGPSVVQCLGLTSPGITAHHPVTVMRKTSRHWASASYNNRSFFDSSICVIFIRYVSGSLPSTEKARMMKTWTSMWNACLCEGVQHEKELGCALGPCRCSEVLGERCLSRGSCRWWLHTKKWQFR
jgi:hypothetical protein